MRNRTIKPALAHRADLYALETETGLPVRFAWAVLPMACDRAGRFVWSPLDLKAELLPHDPIDFSRVLDACLTRGLLVRYRVGDAWFGWVPTFLADQDPNGREATSTFPAVDEAEEVNDYRSQSVTHASSTRAPHVIHASVSRPSGAESAGDRSVGNPRRGGSPTLGVPVAAQPTALDLQRQADALAAFRGRS